MAERRLQAHLCGRRDEGRKLVIPYLTAGLRDDWVDVVAACIDAGADAIEVGIPFSDPVMDGPTIQQSDLLALGRGTTPQSILDDLRALDAPVPLVFMTYYNLVFRAGLERFAADMAEVGLSGIILPDCPLEELGPWHAAAAPHDIATVGLVGPITPDDRLAAVCAAASGYVYGVNLMGVTGVRAEVGEASATLAARIRATTDLPAVMGFGIATPAQAREVADHADGVIVGSALMQILLDGGGPAEAGGFVGSLRAALDAG